MDINTGVIKWKQKINSELRPVIVSDYLITISNEGLLIILDKNNGNIIRINDLLKNMSDKKRNKYFPVGFVVLNEKLYLTTSNGRLIIINFLNGKVDNVIKLSKNKLQRPVYFNKSIYVAKDNSVIRIN